MIVLDGSRRNEPILAPSEQIILARPPGGIVEPQPERGVIERRAAQDDEAVAILFFADRLHRAGTEHGRARLRRHGHDILLELALHARGRSEEHTSELQSLMRISYAVFCLKKKNKTEHHMTRIPNSDTE